MSAKSLIAAVRPVLRRQFPRIAEYAPWVLSGAMPPASDCPNCHRPAARIAVPTDRGAYDVALCHTCEHFTIYRGEVIHP